MPKTESHASNLRCLQPICPYHDGRCLGNGWLHRWSSTPDTAKRRRRLGPGWATPQLGFPSTNPQCAKVRPRIGCIRLRVPQRAFSAQACFESQGQHNPWRSIRHIPVWEAGPYGKQLMARQLMNSRTGFMAEFWNSACNRPLAELLIR